MSLADTLKDLNENGGQTPAAATPPAAPQTPITPAASTPVAPVIPPATPAAPAAQVPPTPAIPKPATPVGTIPKDPPFVKQPPAQAAAPVTPAPGATPPATDVVPQAQTPQEISDDVFHAHLSKLTGGSVKSVSEITALVERYSQLEEQAKKGFEPKYKNERAKVVHQVLDKYVGQEAEAGMRILRAMNFKPEGKSEKDFLFEAYLLDPKNSDLPPLDAQRYFEAEYDAKYSDVENNLLQQRDKVQAVRAAKEAIASIQKDFVVADQQPAQISQEVESAIKGALENFGGVRLAFSDNPAENELMSIPVDDPQVLAAIQEEITSPDKAYNEFVSQFDFSTEEGYQELVREIYQRNNHREIAQQAFAHGAKLERIKVLNELRNASTPQDISNVGTPPPAAKQSFLGTWEGAQKAAGK